MRSAIARLGFCRGRPLGRGTWTPASVSSASAPSGGEALSSRTPDSGSNSWCPDPEKSHLICDCPHFVRCIISYLRAQADSLPEQSRDKLDRIPTNIEKRHSEHRLIHLGTITERDLIPGSLQHAPLFWITIAPPPLTRQVIQSSQEDSRGMGWTNASFSRVLPRRPQQW